jgi:threonine dehydrogenase-like Zn-dependent dehydrogenase
MKAIRFDAAVPRYALGLALKKVYVPGLWSGLSCTYAEEVGEPALPGDGWVKIKTRLGGICGTDLSLIHLSPSYYLEPFSSFPFTIGHENVGHITQTGEGVEGWQIGDRVVVEPMLWCAPRGFDELCSFCARGEINLCERTTEGDLSSGVQIGACRDTGGSWSPSFVAHQSQLYRVPEAVSDENALMVEPFTIGLHAVLQNYPDDHETVLVLGAGTIGLVTLAAMRSLESQARVLVLARYPFQAEAARRLGATEVISAARGEDYFKVIAERTGARIYKPKIGKRVLVGGVDRTFECVGSDPGIDDALRLTGTGGTVVLVGIPGITSGVDWTPVFAHELRVKAAINYNHAESWKGETWKTFDLALDLMKRREVDLGWMVSHRYPLDEYDRALRALERKGDTGVIKAVFEFPG